MQLKPKVVSHCFTTKHNGLSKVLIQEIEITKVGDVSKKFKTKGIWDTGATGTVITKEVFDFLELKQNGIAQVSTASISNETKPTYLVDVFLKSDLRVQAAEVTVGTIAAEHDIHCLIGMDIISLGDFVITNFEGNTCLTFRIPSQFEMDFVKKINQELAIINQHVASKRGMNNPCICGSGKKFKNCHGKNYDVEH